MTYFLWGAGFWCVLVVAWCLFAVSPREDGTPDALKVDQKRPEEMP